LNLFIIQSLQSTRGRFNKRPRANSTTFSASSVENSSPSPNRCRKRVRKTTQLPQFKVYEDEILEADSPNLGAQNESTPVSIEPQTGKIWPHITVEIPSRSDFRPNLATKASKKDYKEPLSSLLSTAINGTQKAPQIPQKWIKNQPNDHTCQF
jgi:hypothetical protein